MHDIVRIKCVVHFDSTAYFNRKEELNDDLTISLHFCAISQIKPNGSFTRAFKSPRTFQQVHLEQSSQLQPFHLQSDHIIYIHIKNKGRHSSRRFGLFRSESHPSLFMVKFVPRNGYEQIIHHHHHPQVQKLPHLHYFSVKINSCFYIRDI